MVEQSAKELLSRTKSCLLAALLGLISHLGVDAVVVLLRALTTALSAVITQIDVELTMLQVSLARFRLFEPIIDIMHSVVSTIGKEVSIVDIVGKSLNFPFLRVIGEKCPALEQLLSLNFTTNLRFRVLPEVETQILQWKLEAREAEERMIVLKETREALSKIREVLQKALQVIEEFKYRAEEEILNAVNSALSKIL